MYNACLITVAVLIITSVIDFKDLYCSSEDLIEAFNNPTIYCKASGICILLRLMKLRIFCTGAIFHYFYFNMTLWWFFHVISVFYKVMFPVFAKGHKKKDKFIHIFLLILGIRILIINIITLILISRYFNSFSWCIAGTVC